MTSTRSNNTISDAGSAAGVWAMERMATDAASKDADSVRVGVWKGPDEALLALKAVYGFGQTFESGHVAEEFRRAFTGRGAPRRRLKWPVNTVEYSFRHDVSGVRAKLCVVCDVAQLMRGEPRELLRTLVFALDCVHRAREVTGFLCPAEAIPCCLSVVVVLWRQGRRLPHPGCSVDSDHVNAGFCTWATELSGAGETWGGSRPWANILVYRAQHAHKVLIHEVIHGCGLDAGLLTGDARQEAAEAAVMRELDYSSTNGSLDGGEAFTETLACFWHMFRVAPSHCLTGAAAAGRKRIRRPRHPVEEVARLWERERRRAMSVCSLLVRHFETGAASTDTAARKGEGGVHRLRLSRTVENAHVMSYFFGKAALWSDYMHRLPCVCLCTTPSSSPTETTATFWSVFERALTDDAFWRAVFCTPPASRLTMTSLGVSA